LTTFRAISRCDAPVADPEPAVNRALAAEMRKVYSSCAISAMLALMIFPIRSIPTCAASWRRRNFSYAFSSTMRILCRVAESFYIGDVQAKLQERAVDRRVRRSRSPSFLPVSSTMTGTIACGYVEGGVRVGMVDRGGAIA
jgi:hypothetical protein